MKSGVPIVAGGGFYSQPFYPKEISTMSEEQIVKALIKQADDDTLGVFGEIGSWDEITADERKVFRAVGTAHVATNLPIFTNSRKVGARTTGYSRGRWRKTKSRCHRALGKSCGPQRLPAQSDLQAGRFYRFRSTRRKQRYAAGSDGDGAH
jgi:hypothetical protein